MSTYDEVLSEFHKRKKGKELLPSFDLRLMTEAICKIFDEKLEKLELKK